MMTGAGTSPEREAYMQEGERLNGVTHLAGLALAVLAIGLIAWG